MTTLRTVLSTAVTGYRDKGADAVAVNGWPILSRHTVRPRSGPRPTSTTTVASPAWSTRSARGVA